MNNQVTQADIQRLESTYLPKWPQMNVWGKSITVEQAKDIILRTDSFLTSVSSYSGGNNRQWKNWARTELGLQELAMSDDISNLDLKYEVEARLRKAIGFVEREYVTNNWASCSFIYGPHGFCHPDGTIWYEDNVGKYPSAREVFEEWQALAAAFTYLDLTVTLFSGEESEDHSYPVISFRVQNGAVAILDEPTVPTSRPVINRDKTALLKAVVTNRSSEQGLDDQWIRDYGEIVRPLVAKLEAEVRQELAQKATREG